MAKIGTLLVLGILAALPPRAVAQESGDAASVETAEKRVAVSAFILPGMIIPMGEVSGELNLGHKMAGLIALGVGKAHVDTRDMSGDFSEEDGFCLRAAGQFRYYLLGNFNRGLFGGAEVAYFFVDRDVDNSVRTPDEGVWIGPTAGYKYTFGFGLLATVGVTFGFPVTRPDGLSEEEAPGSDAFDEKAGAGLSRDVLFWPSLSVGWGF